MGDDGVLELNVLLKEPHRRIGGATQHHSVFYPIGICFRSPWGFREAGATPSVLWRNRNCLVLHVGRRGRPPLSVR
jgi:hypothetical protein